MMIAFYLLSVVLQAVTLWLMWRLSDKAAREAAESKEAAKLAAKTVFDTADHCFDLERRIIEVEANITEMERRVGGLK